MLIIIAPHGVGNNTDKYVVTKREYVGKIEAEDDVVEYLREFDTYEEALKHVSNVPDKMIL